MSIEAMNWALNQSVGNPSGKSVLLILANRADQNGRCWPGIDGIAEQTELTGRTVINQIRRLTDVGLICVERRGGDGTGRKSNVYLLHIAATCSNCTLGQCENDDGQCESGAGQCESLSPEPSDNPKKNRQRGRGGEPPPAGLDDASWTRWFEYRKQIRKPIKPVSIPAAQRKLAGFGAEQAAVVEQSIANGWQGLFALKDREANGQRKPSYAERLAAEMQEKGMLQ